MVPKTIITVTSKIRSSKITDHHNKYNNNDKV